MKYEIKNRFNEEILFQGDYDTLRDCLCDAVSKRANLDGANLDGANLYGANLYGANLDGANLDGANLYGANLVGANLDGANLDGANLVRANLDGANLVGANLVGANLVRANLVGANLVGANLVGANLVRANLVGANLYGANLDGANLVGANLDRANLDRANLVGANLDRANLYGAKNFNRNAIDDLCILMEQKGPIRAYKLVNEKNEGPYNGGIVYEKGKTYTVKANTDEQQRCAEGINLASLAWCVREWKEGYKILVSEFTAKDIAAIPIGTDGKFRVHRCKIVGEKNLKQIGLIK